MGYWTYIIEQGWWWQVLLLIAFLLFMIWFLRRVGREVKEIEQGIETNINSG